MTYTPSQLACGLERQLNDVYDVKHIADWAHAEYLRYGRDFAPGVQAIVMKLVAMEEGPQFELSKEEVLRIIADLKAK